MGLFGKKQNNLVGIDISGGYIRLSQLKVDENNSAVLENYAVLEVPVIKENEDKNSAIIRALKEAFLKLPQNNNAVFAMTAGSDVSIRRVLLPKLSGKDLAEAIKWETKTHFPFPVDKVVIDHHMIGKAEDKGSEKLDTWIVAAQKDLIAQNNIIFEKAGINLNGISVPPFSAWSLLKAENQLKDNMITVFINIGSDITGISFFNGTKLEFYREISIAGNNITNAMVGLFVADNWQMNINYEQAEKIKRQYGIPAEGTEEKSPDGVPLSNILQIIKPVLRRFLNDVLRSFDYYKEQYHRNKIDRVMISGGSSKLLNLVDYLTSGLGIKVETLTQLQNIKLGKNIDAKKASEDLPHLTTSIGLALSKALEINLLTRKKERLNLNLPFDLGKLISGLSVSSSSVKVPAFTGGALLVVFSFVAVFSGFQLNKNINYYSKQLEEKKVMLTDLKLLSERRAILSKIEKEQVPLRSVLAEITNILPPEVILNGFSFVNASKYLVISGTAPSVNSIGALIKNVESSSMFSKTILIEAKKNPSGENTFNMTFSVDI